MNKLVAAGLAAVFALPALAQHAAHEHGVAELEVAVDGRVLSIEVRGPLDNFVGFEHAPRTPEQRAALDRALALLRDPARVVTLPPAAGCKPASVEVADPFAAAPAGDGMHRAEHAPAGREAAGHADLAASYRFDCSQPSALARLEVRLFDAFPRLGRLRAVSVGEGEGGQRAAELRPGKTALPL